MHTVLTLHNRPPWRGGCGDCSQASADTATTTTSALCTLGTTFTLYTLQTKSTFPYITLSHVGQDHDMLYSILYIELNC